MAIPVVPLYPDIARNPNWQKHKSFKDKIKKATKTGLGARLVAAEAAFRNIKFNKLDVHRLQPAGGQRLASYDAVDRAKQAAQEHLNGPVRAAHTAVEAAAHMARDVNSNPALSMQATIAAGAIAKTLESLAGDIDPAHISLSDFDAYKKDLDNLADRSRIRVRRLFPALRGAAELAEHVSTMAGYTASGLHREVLAVNTALSEADDPVLRAWGKQNWAALTKPAFLPKQDGVVQKKITTVLNTLKELEELVD